jgi:hypothetical protein
LRSLTAHHYNQAKVYYQGHLEFFPIFVSGDKLDELSEDLLASGLSVFTGLDVE